MNLFSRRNNVSNGRNKIYKGDLLVNNKIRYELAARGANNAFWDWDFEESALFLSPKWWEIIGEMPSITERNVNEWFDLIFPEDKKLVEEQIDRHLKKETNFFEAEYRIITKNNKLIWILTKGKTFYDDSGIPVRMAGSHEDITAKKEMQNKITFLAYYDALTKLPNRTYIKERIQQNLYRSAREEKYGFSVLFLDFDGFKHVNDTYGHGAGDRLLISISKRLKKIVRPLDSIARIGGDEFLILLDGTYTESGINTIVSRISKNIEKEFVIEDYIIYLSVSIGIEIEKSGNATTDELIQNADIAMYSAKMKGRGQWCFFNETLKKKEQQRWSLENELHRAIKNNELQMYFQPIFNLASGRLFGFESLIRWHHQDRGIILPNDFIPAAEESGYISEITKWVVLKVCEQIKYFDYKYQDLVYSINITSRDFLINGGISKFVEKILEKTNCKPTNLAIEVTEGAIIDSYEQAISQLEKLRERGILIELDDFGTGYSSLSYINNLPLNVVKIDRSFIQAIATDNSSFKIIKSIIHLAHDIGLTVIAEGVEQNEQLNELYTWECDLVQGFLFSEPIAPKNMNAYLENLPQR